MSPRPPPVRAPMRRCRAGISDADQRDRPAVRAPPRGRSRLMNSSMRQPPGTNISAVLLSSCWARHVLALASISLPKGLGRRNEMLLVLSQHHTGSPPCDGGCDNPATELSANDTRYDMTHGANSSCFSAVRQPGGRTHHANYSHGTQPQYWQFRRLRDAGQGS